MLVDLCFQVWKEYLNVPVLTQIPGSLPHMIHTSYKHLTLTCDIPPQALKFT